MSSRTSSRSFDEQVSFKWDEDQYKRFQRAVAKVKADGDVDPAVNKSEALRRVLEHWAENPNAEAINR